MVNKQGQNLLQLNNSQTSEGEKKIKPRLLIIAADDDIRQSAVQAGRNENFVVRAVDNGYDALNLLFNTDYKPFELIIVEHALPGMGSDEICREIRKNDLQTPILVMSAESSDIDLVLSLETGADDFYTKPFSLPVLAAKSRALLRRTIAQNEKIKGAPLIQLSCCDNIVLYEDECRVVKNGVDVELAPLEYKLIKLLMENPKVVWSRDRLIEKVWGFDFAGNTKTVDVHIRWLREKIEKDPSAPKMIKTVRGFGYRFC
jgi:two-component system phosphate regulon response regulator PhoB